MGLLLLLFFNLAVSFVRRNGEQFAGPKNAADFSEWLQGMKQWRTSTRAQIHYDDSVYKLTDLNWTQTTYMQPQSHPYDRYFYDYKTHSYTIDKFLKDLITRYGGIDSILVWPTYPNIGIDNRNQYDLIRSMPPGGVEGLARMVDEFHSHGVKVLWPYNPWDQGTRYEGMSDDEALATLIKATGSDGFNGDTMGSIPENFWQAGLKKGLHLAMEPEGGGNQNTINYDTLGWGYWSYPTIPSVDAWKWLVPKHLTNVCDRWAFSKTDNLQAAWFNGDGYETWENVWGTWNGITPRDGEAIRRVGAMLRYIGRLGLLVSEDWEPHTPVLQIKKGVYASKWPVHGIIAWTFVNRGRNNVTGPQLNFNGVTTNTYYDCYHGVPLKASTNHISAEVTLSFDIEALGYGCVLAFPSSSPPAGLDTFLNKMKTMTARPLEDFDGTWRYLQQTMVPIPPTTPQNSTPPGMVKIPRASFHFVSKGVEIEGDDGHGVDVQYAWEGHPRREHDHMMTIGPFFMDKYPITNSDYANYLKTSGYKPTQTWNFLKHWKNGTYPTHWDKKPVVWVSLNEARQYCSAHGKRLPHSYEWQYAAQGTDGRTYPWGSHKDQNNYPKHTTGRTMGAPSDVDAHPGGASPFGVQDLVGNVWQMTDEFHDAHTRGLIVKGSSYYRSSGSNWYFPEALELNLHNKYLLMDDSYERSGALGFRCVVDGFFDNHCHDPLCGKLGDLNSHVDLTKEGTIDWTHYGTNKPSDINRKAVKMVIGTLKMSSSAMQYGDNPVSFSWEDGTVMKTNTGTTTGIYIEGVGNAFTITVPAGTQRQIFRLYVGVYQSSMKLTASLSDGSPIYTDASLSGSANGVYELNFQTKTTGQSLTVEVMMKDGNGNITFQAATLAPAPK